MKYIIIVSHGDFAYGMESALKMLDGGQRDDIIAMGLTPDMGSEVYTKEFKKKLSGITPDDEILLFGDIGGGSPLTMAANVLSEMGLMGAALIYGGSSLPLVLNASLMKDIMTAEELDTYILETAKDELKKMDFGSEDAEDEI